MSCENGRDMTEQQPTNSKGARAPTSPSPRTSLSSGDPLVLGVATRVADRLGASVAVVRVAFVLLTLALGWGALLYLLLAGLLVGRTEPAPRPVHLTRNLGVVLATAAQVLIVEDFVTALPAMVLWPVGLVLFAVVLADPDLDRGTTSRQSVIGRVVAGVVLMLAGLITAFAGTNDLGSVWRSGIAALVLLGGVGLILAPWLQNVLSSADADRRERIRAEERADIAAHLHDSVLQTLTLIQNRASDPQLTAALAHQQERELRRWLYDSAHHDSAHHDSAHHDSAEGGDRSVTFRGALERAAAEVEDQYLKIVECIVVGDTSPEAGGLPAASVAMIGAAREAMVNAAKFADIPMISVFAEVGDDSLLVFVRDRGVGFEPALVPADRHGVSDSICGRIERLGGEATVRSSPGQGTEVRIELPR